MSVRARASLTPMRSKESTDWRQEATATVAREPKRTPNAEFGAHVTRLAKKAGFDLTPGQAGRTELAETAGLSVWAIGRILSGEALPRPENFQRIAQAVNAQTTELLTVAGIIPPEEFKRNPTSASDTNEDVLSPGLPVSPETAADLLGVTHPMVRPGLVQYIDQAVRLQNELDRGPQGAAAQGG